MIQIKGNVRCVVSVAEIDYCSTLEICSAKRLTTLQWCTNDEETRRVSECGLGGQECLIPVGVTLVRRMKEDLWGDALLEFTSPEY
jgi:hypothetical protein